MGKVAIVTGGNKGIGFGIVKGLAKVFDGDVFLTARNVERGMEAVKKLEQENIHVKFHQLDIDDPKSNAAIAKFMKENYGGIDILVNNAGIAFKRDATEPIDHQAKVTITTNYFRYIRVKKYIQSLLGIFSLRNGFFKLHRVPLDCKVLCLGNHPK